MTALTEAFIIGALLCFLAVAFSVLRGKKTSFDESGSLKKPARSLS